MNNITNNINHNKQCVLWTLYIDGAARGNPGPAGIGIFILKDNASFLKKGFFIGAKTNNQAEYTALIAGLYYLEPFLSAGDLLHIFSDSKLLVCQLNGHYKIKHEGLRPIYICASLFLQDKRYVIKHIDRSSNIIADKLANDGIDNKYLLPASFQEFCLRYNCSIF